MGRLNYQKLKAAGLCVFCGCTKDDPRVMCQTCRDTQREGKKNRKSAIAITTLKYNQKNWFKKMIEGSKRKDIKMNRFNAAKNYFISEEFLTYQRKFQQNKCYHCGIFMQSDQRKQNDGLTVERLDNAIGHTKSNCVLACYPCNIHRLTDKQRERSIDYIDRRVAEVNNHNVCRAVMSGIIDTVVERGEPQHWSAEQLIQGC